jgi:hypothetical protein
MSSEIVSHTIFLGMPTLATFVGQLDLRVTSEVTIVEIYTVWDKLSKLEAHARRTATTYVMGALRRALGQFRKW